MADYSPSANFSFGAESYSPSAGLTFAAPTFGYLAAGFQHSITVPVHGSIACSLQYQLSAATFGSIGASLQWALVPMDFSEASFEQQWGLSPTALVFSDVAFAQQWQQQNYTYSVSAQSQQWSVSAYNYAQAAFEESWAVAAPTLGSFDVGWLWGLAGLSFGSWDHSFLYGLEVLGLAQMDWAQQWACEADHFTKEKVLTIQHMDGSGQTFISEQGPELIAYGDAQQVTSDYKFGAGCGYFDGVGDYLQTEPTTAFNVGSGDFYCEAWVKFVDTQSRVIMRSASTTESGRWTVFRYGASYIYFEINGTLRAARTATMPNNTWIHVAAGRNNAGKCRVWVNGVMSTDPNSLNYSGDIQSPGGLNIGQNNGNLLYEPAGFKGYLDEVLVTNEVLYFGDFFLPTDPYAWLWSYRTLQHEQEWKIIAPEAEHAQFEQAWGIIGSPVWTRARVGTTYTMVLTGAADETTDITIPMASFSTRMKDGDPSYLQVSVPDARTWSVPVSDRPNGEIVISRGDRYSDGSIEVTEIARALLTYVSVDIGARSSSISMQGRSEATNPDPQTIEITGVSYRSTSGGKRRFRCPINNALRPGDSAIIGNEVIVVTELQHQVSVGQSYMELSEE